MARLSLELHDEVLSFKTDPPIISQGDDQLPVDVDFDENWTGGQGSYTLYTLLNDQILERVQIENGTAILTDETLNKVGRIELCVESIRNETSLDQTVIFKKTSTRLPFKIVKGIDDTERISEYPTIYFYRNCAGTVNFDFSNFEMHTGKVIMTIKRTPRSNTLFTYEFDESKNYELFFSKDFIGSLNYSEYLYDFIYVDADHNQYPLCIPSKIVVKEMVANG